MGQSEKISPDVKANKISIIEEDHLQSSSLAASTKSSCSESRDSVDVQLEKRNLCLRLGFYKKLEQCYKPDESIERALLESAEANNTREVALMKLGAEDERENTMRIQSEKISPDVKANKISIIE